MKKQDYISQDPIFVLPIILEDEEQQRYENMAYLKNRHKFTTIEEGRKSLKSLKQDRGPYIFVEETIREAEDEILDYANKILKKDNFNILAGPFIDQVGADKDDHFSANVLFLNDFDIDDIVFENPVNLVKPKKVTKKDIKKALLQLQKDNVRLTPKEEPAQKDDVVLVDYSETIDNLATNKSQRYFKVGEDDQAIDNNGKELKDFLKETKAEDIFEYSLENNTEISGKVLEVYSAEYPELDDEFASEVSEFETLEELSNDLNRQLETNEEVKAFYKNLLSILNTLVLEQSKIQSFQIPDVSPVILETIYTHNYLDNSSESIKEVPMEAQIMDSLVKSVTNKIYDAIYLDRQDQDLKMSFDEFEEVVKNKESDNRILLELLKAFQPNEINSSEKRKRLYQLLSAQFSLMNIYKEKDANNN